MGTLWMFSLGYIMENWVQLDQILAICVHNCIQWTTGNIYQRSWSFFHKQKFVFHSFIIGL